MKNFNFFKLINSMTLILSLFCISGCYYELYKPNQNFQSSDRLSLIWGRLEFQNNSLPLTFNGVQAIGNGFRSDTAFVIFLEPFKSINEIDKMPNLDFRSDTINIGRPDGYFATVLTPGTYYIKGFKLPPKSDLTGYFLKTYSEGDSKSFLIRLTALPGKATYVGTMKINYDTEKRTGVRREQDRIPMPSGVKGVTTYQIREYNEPYTYTAFFIGKGEITNEFDKSKSIFYSLFPKHSEPVVNLAEVVLDPLGRKKE